MLQGLTQRDLHPAINGFNEAVNVRMQWQLNCNVVEDNFTSYGWKSVVSYLCSKGYLKVTDTSRFIYGL